MAREGFVFYRSFAEAFRGLDASQYRDIVTAISDYALDGIEPEGLDPVLYGFFVLMKPQIDANEKKRQAKIKTNGEDEGTNSEESGTKRNKTEQNGTNSEESGTNENKLEQKCTKEKEKENVKEKVNVKEKDNTPQPPSQGEKSEADDRFDAFWTVYPKKVGKGDARKAFGKIRPSEAMTGRMIAAIMKQSQSEQWKRDHGRYIPNPSTWLNQQRWEDDVPPDMGAPDQKGRSAGTRFANFEQRPFDDDDEALGTAWLKKYQGEG